MYLSKDWTIGDVGELVLALKLMRPVSEIASALGRNEQDVQDKIAELDLAAPASVVEPKPRRERGRRAIRM